MQSRLDLARRLDDGFLRVAVDMDIRPDRALRAYGSPAGRRAVVG